MLSCLVTPFIKNFSEKKIPGFLGICYQCNFCTDGYSDSNVKHFLGENLHESLGRAVAKRKSEFVAGRYLARKALTALGANNTSVEIGANRAPLWPDSFIGSISHSEGFAICAVANRDDLKGIGIDVESFIDVKVAREIVGSVLIDSEYKLVGTYTNPNPVTLTLIFSAKESLFKALYPAVGRYFDFNAAHTKEIDFQTGKFTIELVQELAPTLPVGTRFEGLFELDNNKVFTVIFCLN
ncbi:4'-phosphopantetheinyl transferase superfamily protein [Vibrio vulnificus]|uniref:4'-phosphopantetheinyl transferase family protein n=1 Tax=Vibrio vulnificus TaxID=672 RepID=UPI001028BF46|nr:4'-phosphopantetheinyl transferase superfamily protein [Vibrio vulnificus]RZP95346.1 4'-phosphopantetheinyl transferase superfamily protein [Vibrio vulnificus]